MTSPQPPVDYTSRDFAGFVAEMKLAAVTRMPEWTSTNPLDFGNVLLECWAYLGDILSYYSDRVANESFLSTATQYQSVLNIATLLDYRPRGTSAAQVLLTITMPQSVTVTIPALTQITTDPTNSMTPAVIFQTDADVVAVASGSDIAKMVTFTVSATQGIVTDGEVVGTSDGTPSQSFTLLQTPVVDGSVVVSVKESPYADPQTWTFIEHLVDAAETDNSYTSNVNAVGAVSVTFGDGVSGRIPPAGSVVYVTYRVGGGPVGNVGVGALGAFANITPLVAASGNVLTAANLQVTNALAANGGASAEGIESIRANAPPSIAALNRAVTIDDYPALAIRVPRVAKASAAGVVYTNIMLFVAPAGAGAPTTDLLNAVSSYFVGKTMAGVSVTVSTPVYQPIDITAIVQAGAPYSQSTVQSNVIAALTDLLSFDSVDFGERVTVSSVYDAIQNAAGVAYATIGVLDLAGGSNAADINLPINTIPIVGTIDVSVVGGVNASIPSGTLGSVAGPVSPGVPGTPQLELSRCDSDSSHFELFWTDAINADHYDVVFTYLSSSNFYPDNVVKQVTYGPFTSPQAVIDAALVGNASLIASMQAVTVQMQIQAYNGTSGPITSNALTMAYQCEQSTVPTGVYTVPPSRPQVTNFVATSYDGSGDPIYTFNASWTPPTGTSTTQLVYQILDQNGDILAGSGSSALDSLVSLTGYTVTVPKDVSTSIRFYVNAYNGSIGPIAGPSTTIPLTVPVIGTVVTPVYLPTPVLVSSSITSATRLVDNSVTVDITTEVQSTERVGYSTAYLDSSGVVIAGSQSAVMYESVYITGDSVVDLQISVPAPPNGSSPTDITVTIFAANPNGTSASTVLTAAY